MANDENKIPVYLITGFIDSGKTTFLNHTLKQDYFHLEESTLLISTEEGEKAYNEEELQAFGVIYEEISEKEDLTFYKLTELEELYHPGRVLIEYNPFWRVKSAEVAKLPDNWRLFQQIVTVDASTFRIYQSNMKPLFVEMTQNADMVIFNRCTEDMPLADFSRGIKVLKPDCEIIFENTAGKAITVFDYPVPYDTDDSVIYVNDKDFGILFVDLRENFRRYQGKKIMFRAQIRTSCQDDVTYFVTGRAAMTCCADDIQFIGYVCEFDDTEDITEGMWIILTADVRWKYEKIYRGKGPVLYASDVSRAEPPKEELIYFT